MNRKIFALLLVFIMVFSLLAGCGNTSDVSDDVTDANVTPAPETNVSAPSASIDEPGPTLPIVEETATFTIWYSWVPLLAAYIDGPWEVAFYKEMESRTNVALDFETVSLFEVSTLFNVMVMSGDYCDIITSATDYYVGGGDAAVDDGFLVELTPYLDLMPNYSAIRQGDSDVMIGTTTDKGRLVVFQTLYAEKTNFNGGLVVRQDWLDKLDMEIPETYGEMHDVLEAFKTELGVSDPLIIMYNGITRYNNLDAGFGTVANVISPYTPFYLTGGVDGTVNFGPVSEGFLEYATLMNQWYNEGLIYSDFVSQPNYDTPTDMVTTGASGIYYASAGSFESYRSAAVEDSFRIVPIPDPLPDGDSSSYIQHNTTRVGSNGWGISTACGDVETVCRYLDYYYSEEGQLLSNYGIADLTFTFREDGTPVFTELVTNNEQGLTMNDCLTIYCLTSGPVVYDWEKNYSVYTADQKLGVPTWNTYYDDSVYHQYPTYVAMTSEESAEYLELMGDIQTYINECLVQFIIGQMPLDSFDVFIKTLEGMGIQRAVDIKQAALDRYFSR